jgi:hypothetical protein
MSLPHRPLPIVSRRTVLRGAFGAAVGLPWLASLDGRRAGAAATAIPTRFVVMFSPDGTLPPQWTPTGTETDFVLSPILSPLAAHQADLVVVHGVDQRGAGGDGHQTGIGGMLTGQSLNPGPFAGGGGSAPAGWANGQSVDQRIAEVLGTTTSQRSLELGVQVGAADNWGRMCYRAANQPLPPEEDPAQVYANVFADLHADPAALAALRQRRKSILDTVGAQYTRIAQRLASDDQARLDEHLTAVREIEQRLTTPFTPPSAACHDPAVPAPATTANDDFPAIGALQMDLLVMALACDVTRVASLMWSRSVSQVRFTWLDTPIPEGHHDLSHRGDDDLAAVDKLTRINQWYATQLATLITKLKAVPQADGSTLLDHTLILWCNELAKGNTHSRVDAPYVLAGSAGGALRTGRYLSYDGDVPHNNLLVSILNAMGIPDTTFGRPDWCTGPLPNLL